MTQETKTAWVVESNTDLTEGRGTPYPKYVCETEATARRLAKNGYVQGSNCPIRTTELIKVKGDWCWFGPVVVQTPTSADLAEQLRLDTANKALARAKELGLTEEEIKALRS